MSNGGNRNYGIILNGNAKFEAQNVAVGENAKIEVTSQLDRLRDNIHTLPDSLAQEKADLEKFRRALEAEAEKPKPSKSIWEVNAKGLLDAAKAVAMVTPEILTTAERVVSWIGKVA